MYYYHIAEMNICVSWENAARRNRNYQYHDCIVLPRSLEAFYSDVLPEVLDMKVKLHELSEFTSTDSYKRIRNQAFIEKEDKLIMTVFDPYDNNRPGYSIEMSKNYAQVDYIPHIREYEHDDLQWMMYPFEGRLLYTGGVVLHGVAVEYMGKGFLFTGASGAGKTTQAHLWQKYRDALIINGDCPSIRIKGGTPYVYGTPWCGTSGESINRRTHLGAVVLVKKGATDSIRELKGNSAFLALLANVLHSSFDKAAFDLSIINLKQIIEHIKVYELTGTISEAAVKVLEKEIRTIQE